MDIDYLVGAVLAWLRGHRELAVHLYRVAIERA
ncbi:MAG: hypothetical protein JWM53_634 [bacterium]|nr:hypothetical protein [bacterium]